MAKSDPGHRRLVIKTDSPARPRPNGKDRSRETIAESRFKGLRSRQDPHSERSRSDSREIWSLEGVLGLLSENSFLEILNSEQNFSLTYLELDVVRGCAFPRACLTRTALPHPWCAKSSAGGNSSLSNYLSSATALPGETIMVL